MVPLNNTEVKSDAPPAREMSLSQAGAIPIDAFPMKVQGALKTFDHNGDGLVSPLELASAAEAYKVQRKYTSRLLKLSGFAVLGMVLLAFANMATAYLAVKWASDTVVKKTTDGQAELVSKTGQILETGTAIGKANLSTLPATADFDAYERLTTLTYPDLGSTPSITLVDGKVEIGGMRTKSARVTSWDWESKERMSFALDNGATVLVDHENVLFAAAPTSGVTHDSAIAASQPGSTGLKTVGLPPSQSAHSAALLNRTSQLCLAHGCAPASCASHVGLVMSTPTVTALRCDGFQLWKWPTGVTPAEASALVSASEQITMGDSKPPGDVADGRRQLKDCGPKQTVTSSDKDCTRWTCTISCTVKCKCTGRWTSSASTER